MTSVSIVIPALGTRGDRLDRAIQSGVLAEADEIVVVDDATTDDSVAELAARLGVRCVRRDHNGGVAAAQNTGIESCKTDALCFLHSDDTVPSDRFTLQLPLIDQSGIVGGAMQYADGMRADPAVSATPSDFLHHRFGVHISPYLFRRDVLVETRFDENLRAWEDWDLMYRLNRRGLRVTQCDATTSCVTIDAEDRLESSSAMYSGLRCLYDKYEADMDRSQRAEWAFKLARGARRSGDTTGARRWLGTMVREEPWHPRRVLAVLATRETPRAPASGVG